jgi:hypothetical protein
MKKIKQNHQTFLDPTRPLRNIIKIAEILSQSFDIILEVSTKLLKILFGLSYSSNLLYRSIMN